MAAADDVRDPPRDCELDCDVTVYDLCHLASSVAKTSRRPAPREETADHVPAGISPPMEANGPQEPPT